MKLPPLDVAGLLKEYGLRPDKSLGQNFLVDPVALQRVVAAAEVSPEDTVLEIGPGLGSLTRYLAAEARKVIAVELDTDLIPPLARALDQFENVQVVQGDILELDPSNLMETADYLVVANIPYYITSALIRHLLETRKRPRRIVLTVQREVAMRITAGPGDLSLLALSVQVFGHPQVVARIPAGAFFPPPKVDSAVVRVDLYPEPRIPPSELDTFFQLAKAGFSQKRKTLRNALSAGLGWRPDRTERLLAAAGIDPRRRAQSLSLDEWSDLVTAFLTLSPLQQPNHPQPPRPGAGE